MLTEKRVTSFSSHFLIFLHVPLHIYVHTKFYTRNSLCKTREIIAHITEINIYLFIYHHIRTVPSNNDKYQNKILQKYKPNKKKKWNITKNNVPKPTIFTLFATVLRILRKCTHINILLFGHRSDIIISYYWMHK